MSKALLLDTRNQKYYRGDTRLELCEACPDVEFDFLNRQAIIKGKPDTFSFSCDYTDDELPREMSKRVVGKLCQDHGFILYVNESNERR